MQADHVFAIGRSHKVCEDYARSGVMTGIGGVAYSLISDGCSGSEDTDVGARLIVSSAEQFILKKGGIYNLDSIREIIVSASSVQRLMGLDETILDATLLGISVSHDIDIFGVGDGVIAIKMKSGNLNLYELDAPSGYPLYPSYLLSRWRKAEVEKSGGLRVRSIHEVEGDISETAIAFDSNVVDVFSMSFVNDTGDDEDSFETIAVFSDGVMSFMDEDRRSVPWLDVVRELMCFKGHKGEFVKRRMNGFLRACEKRGWTHDDDVSMAAVHFG